MKSKTIYFLFTDTGTTLSRIINFFTRQSLNHVSISFDRDLSEVYSFGRKRPRNPFIGGFIHEDINGDFLRDANCAVYSFKVTEAECRAIIDNITEIETKKNLYRYNFIGLIGVLFQIEINRKRAFFCSQFIARIMTDVDSFQMNKPQCFVTPMDIRSHSGMQLVYKGTLRNYYYKAINMEHIRPVSSKSFVLLLSEKIKRFVIR